MASASAISLRSAPFCTRLETTMVRRRSTGIDLDIGIA